MGVWQALVAGLFGLSSGADLECYSIRNQCSKGLYVAFGYPMPQTSTTVTHRTRGWWLMDGGLEKRYCFRRHSYLYAYFDWAGTSAGHYGSDVSFSLGQAKEFCVSQRRSNIERNDGCFAQGFTDELTGLWAQTCEGLGIGATMRAFEMIDDGNYGSATVSHCPSWQSSEVPVAPILEVSHEPFNPNSTDLQHLVNATDPFAVLGYDPEKGWSVEEAQNGPDDSQSSENPLLP
eukprot:Skav204489  [mRNA]  locus=scaffold535:245975:246673:+ [translate_table: standard]